MIRLPPDHQTLPGRLARQRAPTLSKNLLPKADVILQKTFAFLKNSPDICSVNKTKHELNHYKQSLVVAQYQFLIMCYSAMIRSDHI